MDQQKVDIWNKIENITKKIIALSHIDDGDNRVIYEMVMGLEQEKDKLYDELFDIFEAEENNKYNLFEKRRRGTTK